jgi:hypothetical protein
MNEEAIDWERFLPKSVTPPKEGKTFRTGEVWAIGAVFTTAVVRVSGVAHEKVAYVLLVGDGDGRFACTSSVADRSVLVLHADGLWA